MATEDEEFEMVHQPDPEDVQSGHSTEEQPAESHNFAHESPPQDAQHPDDDDLDPNNPNYPKPTSKARISLQRPKQEKKIGKQDFRKYRGQILKRLSSKQRMPFDQIVSRNIHAGLEDELNEKRPMEKSKKILQLNRRLSHRPHPSDIQHDDEAPPDLRRADSEYYKLYKYRQATEKDIEMDANDEDVKPPRDRTTSDPNPKNKPIHKLIKPATGKTSIENPLDWKFGQRSSTKELQIRGIIPEQYADVVHGEKSLEEAKAEWEAYRKESQKKIKNKIDLKFRPSKQDLVDRGIVPDWDNPQINKLQKKRNTDLLKMKLSQRMDPDEADQRAIINKDDLFSNKDYDQIRAEKKEASKQLRSKMRASITQRADKSEIVFRGIVPREFLDDDADVAKTKLRKARVSVKQQMNEAFGNRPAPDDITRLLLQTADSAEPQPFQPPIPLFSAEQQLRSPASPYNPLPTTPEYDEVDESNIEDEHFPTFLDRMKAEKKATKQTMETHLRRRSTVEDLQKRGILPLNQSSREYDADADNEEVPELRDRIATQADDDSEDDEEFVSFLDRMKAERKQHRKSIEQSHRRRPTVEDLKQRGIYKDQDIEAFPDQLESKPPVYMSDEYANSLNRQQMQRQRDDNDEVPEAEVEDSSDDSKDEYPTFLDRKKNEEKQIKKKLKAFHQRRPSKQDMEDRGIVERGYFENMQVVLDKKRERRKSFTTELASFFQQRPDIAEMLTKGLVAAEFIGMDATEMKQKRKAIKQTLNRKLNKKRRPTMDDLELRGIVPSGYFNDAQKAVSGKHVRRTTAEQELTSFLPKRMDPKKMFERGMIPQQHFQNIMGMTIPIPTMVQVSPEMFPDNQVKIEEVDEEDEASSDEEDVDASGGVTKGGDDDYMTMNKQQQAFSAGAMGVADGAPVIIEPDHHHHDGQAANGSGSGLLQLPQKRHSQRVSGIANVVLDLPQHAERNVFDHDSWTQNLYESLLNSLRFGQIPQRIEKAKTNDNFGQMSSISAKYQEFERLHHTRMNGLQREKKIILDQIVECDQKENESLETLKNLMTEHSELEQKIRPQMKMLLHKMTLVETRIQRLEQKGDRMTEQDKRLKEEYEKELNYYDTYITELKNVFIHTNNIRAKYQNSIRTVIDHKAKLQSKLQQKEQEIANAKVELNQKFQEFHAWINSVLSQNDQQNDNDNGHRALVLSNKADSEQKYDPLASDPITDLTKVLNERNQNIDDNLDLLSFRISTIPATDYALRVIELCQLSYIYSAENLKSFFEWFIRFAVQSFIEINYAHTCFTTQNKRAIDEEINQLKSVQFLANLTPTPEDNKVYFDKALFETLTVIVSYLELLPSNNDGGVTPNNNIDHEYVIFHVARYLTADFNFSQTLLSEKTAEDDIPQIAQTKVEEWISAIVRSNNSSLTFSNDYNKLTNANMDKPRDLIKATREDSAARIKPGRAAAIVMDHVYGIHVDG